MLQNPLPDFLQFLNPNSGCRHWIGWGEGLGATEIAIPVKSMTTNLNGILTTFPHCPQHPPPSKIKHFLSSLCPETSQLLLRRKIFSYSAGKWKPMDRNVLSLPPCLQTYLLAFQGPILLKMFFHQTQSSTCTESSISSQRLKLLAISFLASTSSSPSSLHLF